jgi:hypothetical protein
MKIEEKDAKERVSVTQRFAWCNYTRAADLIIARLKQKTKNENEIEMDNKSGI